MPFFYVTPRNPEVSRYILKAHGIVHIYLKKYFWVPGVKQGAKYVSLCGNVLS
jgi:hypothetical protein